MRVLIVYATTEGHTRDLARFVERALVDDGREVVVAEAPGAPPAAVPSAADPSAYDATLLMGSLHVGRYQPGLVRFARARRAQLAATPSALVSVSLSAASLSPDDWRGLRERLDRFMQETGWSPVAVHQAAGALRYSRYGFLKRLVLKRIAARRGHRTATSRDYDFTDYAALARFCRQFVAAAEPRAVARLSLSAAR